MRRPCDYAAHITSPPPPPRQVAANSKKPSDKMAVMKSSGVVDACQAAGKVPRALWAKG